jgi:hypothetical protein
MTLVRQHIRHGVRAVQAGRDPAGLWHDARAVIPTYCNDTILAVPPAATPEAGKTLLRQTGWALAQEYLTKALSR